jgi:AcrR family transcriptional regulator
MSSRGDYESEFTLFPFAVVVSKISMRVRASSPRRARAAGRRFKQARAERTFESLLNAAGEIFAEAGYDGAQTPDIARRAGVSTGAFYRYFDDKRQAFLEVVTRRLEQATGDVLAELEPERFRPTSRTGERRAIEMALDVMFDRIRRDAPLERVLLEMSLRDPEVMKIRARFDALSIGFLTKMIDDIIPRRVIPSPRAAALVIHAAALEIATERAGLGPARGAGLRDGEVREALREMIHRYLYPR